jgi:FkbH-like protein
MRCSEAGRFRILKPCPARLQCGTVDLMSHTAALDLQSLPLDQLLMERRTLRRRLASRDHLQPVRIAVLGGSTTNEVVNLLELWLLESGFSPEFHQSAYGRYHVDAVYDSQALVDFKPDVVYVHTSIFNLQGFAPLQSSEEEFRDQVAHECSRFQEIWTSISEKIGCVVIQNNFELPPFAILGNLDATATGGHTRFVAEMNREFALAAGKNSKLLIQDICSISSRIGLNCWFDHQRWFSHKIATTLEGSRALAISLNAMVRAIYGKTRKVLVLDLDNTLWGGVIGDDGPERIQIGRETPLAEAYTAFQEYCLMLRNRGVLLAVCSKNNEGLARQGFEHPDSILKLEHISSFKANWDPKPENIALIAKELNLGADSFVFVDDSPAERAIVEGQVNGIAVPNVGADVAAYASMIEAGRFFEQTSFSKEDIQRAALYQENSQRAAFETRFADYGDYLNSLEMTAEIDRFRPVYIERIAQLTNKTNQFNLTTRRYTLAEMERIASDPNYIGIYGKLSDRFGDHGLISVVLGRREEDALHMDLWLMSCRVLKRGMEAAMLDAVVHVAVKTGLRSIVGIYLPTKKNGMVADFYAGLGFSPILGDEGSPEGATTWELKLTGYTRQNKYIKLMEYANA